MKKVFLFIAVVAFLGIIAVPTYSVITINSSVVLDDPPKTKEVTEKETVKDENKKCEKKSDKENCKKVCSKEITKSCCSSKNKKN